MATFEAQVEGLTSLSIDGSSAPTQTELTQFLTDGAKEILSVLPKQKKAMYSTSNTLDSGDTTLTIGGSEILGVVRNDGTIDQPCRRIPLSLSGRAQDSEEMIYGTVTDPVWWITINALNMFPTPTDAQNGLIQTLAYPAVAYGDSAITKFPDEAEYLVPIYASIKAIQNALGAKAGNSDITTALTAINTEIDECLSIADSAATEIGLANAEADKATAEVALANTEVDKMAAEVVLANAEVDLSNAEVDKMAAEIALTNSTLDAALSSVGSNVDTATAAIATAAGRVNTAVALANTQFDSAVTANSSEDIELASSHVKAGQGFISEAQAAVSEAQTYVNEVSSRVNQVNAEVQIAQGYIGTATGYGNIAQGFGQTAQGYISTANGYGGVAQGFLGIASGFMNTAQGYIATANAYLQQIQAKIGIAQGYANEAQSRLSVLTTEYTWLEKQQAKLQADYDKGLQMIAGA